MFETVNLWIQALSQNLYYLMINTKFIISIIDRPMESLSIIISTKDSSLGQAKEICFANYATCKPFYITTDCMQQGS